MEVITLKELHQHTGRYARAARERTVLITDRGHAVAMLTAPLTAQLERPLPRRFSPRLAVAPKRRTDSTKAVGAGRDDR